MICENNISKGTINWFNIATCLRIHWRVSQVLKTSKKVDEVMLFDM